MLKIMLVDDEINIVEGLKVSIDWAKYGYRVIGEAYNGKEALAIAMEQRPNVILTDITMPVMDGMELVERIREYLPDIKVIFLTCHEEFNFVRQALKLNVYDYLIKETMTREELYSVLQKISEEIKKERSQKDIEVSIKLELNKNRYYIGESIINEILQCNVSNIGELENRLNLYGYRFKYKSFTLSVLEIDNYKELINNGNYKDDNLVKFLILNIIEEILHRYDIGKVFSMSEKEFVILYNFDSNLKVRSLDRIKQISSEIQGCFKKKFGSTCTLYIGEKFSSLVQTKDVLNKIRMLENARFYMLNESIITLEDLIKNVDGKTEYLQKDVNKFKELLYNFYKEDSIDVINKMIDRACVLKTDVLQIKYIAERIFASINNFLEKYFNEYNQLLLNVYVQEIKDAHSIFAVKNILIECINLAFEMLEKNSTIQTNTEIAKVLQYINSHFQEDITLEQMADYVCMNSSYYSRYFKSKTGENFVYYLTRIRIEKAKELLLNTEFTIDNIAEKVGHVNKAYFMKVFKKFTGITPGEFRKVKKRDQSVKI